MNALPRRSEGSELSSSQQQAAARRLREDQQLDRVLTSALESGGETDQENEDEERPEATAGRTGLGPAASSGSQPSSGLTEAVSSRSGQLREQLQQARALAQTAAKVAQTAKRARTVILILQAIGTFIAATWWIWLIIIGVVFLAAAACEQAENPIFKPLEWLKDLLTGGALPCPK